MNKYTNEMIEFLKEVAPQKTYKEITELFNKKFNLEVTAGIIKNLLSRKKIYTGTLGQFKKGSIPWNKGLKTGIKPRRYDKNGDVIWIEKPVGSEYITNDGYTIVKTKAPNFWEYKQRVIWKKTHGEIPHNHVIIFADGNKSNFDIDNLICVSKNELRQLNRYKLKKDDADLTKVGIGIVKLKHAAWKLKTKK